MVLSIYRNEVDELRAKMEAGKAQPCFGLDFLKDPATANLGEDQVLYSLGSLMEAGSDTSRMSISQVIAAAATDPRWVVAARSELDAICGAHAERLPDFADRERLRYISSVVKEGFRWRPFAEIGVPHSLIKDDEYEGYRFPAGTLFTWNAWHISMSEDEYDQPSEFRPERWLDSDASTLVDPLKGHYSFGPGEGSPCNSPFMCVRTDLPKGGECALAIMLETRTSGLPSPVFFIASISSRSQYVSRTLDI